MNTITFPGLLIEQAKEVLSACYDQDKSATFTNAFNVHGSYMHGRIVKNEQKSNSRLSIFDVIISSDIVSEVTLREKFADQIYRFC